MVRNQNSQKPKPNKTKTISISNHKEIRGIFASFMFKLYHYGAYLSMTYLNIFYKMYIGELIMLKEYRKRQNLSQEKLSDLTGIDRKTIFRIENDKNMPKIDTYAKIVMALNMSNEEICDHLRSIAKDNLDSND